MNYAPRHVVAAPRRPALRAGGVEFWAGVEDRSSAPQSRPSSCLGSAGSVPLPLRSSTPAQNSTPSGEFGAGYYSIVESRDPENEPRASRWAAGRSSLVLQQMISTDDPRPQRSPANQARAGPRGLAIVPSGLRPAVNPLAGVLRFAPPLRVTAGRPAGPKARPRGLQPSRMSPTPKGAPYHGPRNP